MSFEVGNFLNKMINPILFMSYFFHNFNTLIILEINKQARMVPP